MNILCSLPKLCFVCLILIRNVNAWFGRDISFFDIVDLNKDGIITKEEGHTNPNKTIVKEWMILENMVPEYVLKEGLTRRELYELSRTYGKI